MPSIARAAGLITPTTSPPRLASLRTLTQVRATAGVHVMLSIVPAAGTARLSVRVIGADDVEISDVPPAIGVGITPSLVVSSLKATDSALRRCVTWTPKGDPYHQAAAATETESNATAAERQTTGDRHVALGSTPHQWQVASNRRMIPQPRQRDNFTRSPREFSRRNG